MELMAGVGRNYNTLKYFFSNIEMIEQSPEMYKKIPTEVTIHKKLVQDFEWPIKEYDCVVGVWCFCYLNESDMQKQTTFIKESLKTGGHFELFETVVGFMEKQVPRFYHHMEQQMLVRPEKDYHKLFKENEFRVIHSQRYSPINVCIHDQVVFVLEKENS